MQSIAMSMSVYLNVSPYVCLYVCRSRISKTTCTNFTKFSVLAVVRSSSDAIAIRYVLPVLWMTSCIVFP